MGLWPVMVGFLTGLRLPLGSAAESLPLELLSPTANNLQKMPEELDRCSILVVGGGGGGG